MVTFSKVYIMNTESTTLQPLDCQDHNHGGIIMFPKVNVTISETSHCLSSGMTVVRWSQFQNFMSQTQKILDYLLHRSERREDQRREQSTIKY